MGLSKYFNEKYMRKIPLLKRWDFWFMVIVIGLLLNIMGVFASIINVFEDEPDYKDVLNNITFEYENNPNSTILVDNSRADVYLTDMNKWFEIDTSSNNGSCDDVGYSRTYGMYSGDDNHIYLNYPMFENNSFVEGEFQANMINTLLHEVGHYLENKNSLEHSYKYFNISINETTDEFENPQYFIGLYNETYLELDNTYEKILSSIDFESVYYDRCYSSNNYAEETAVRIYAYCLEQDSTDNKLKWSENAFCDNFEVSNYYIEMYNNYIGSFTDSLYVWDRLQILNGTYYTND